MGTGGRQLWVAVLAASMLATGLCVALVDRPAATFAHDAFHGGAIFVALTHIVDPVLPLSAIGFLLIGGGLLLGWAPPRGVRIAFCVCVAALLAIVIKDQLKYAFGRTWPETWVNNNPSWIRDGVAAFVPFHGGTGWTSFPSGHMTSITAPMVVLMRVARPAWRAAMVLPILLVALGLFGADFHFVGDMMAGVVVGSVCAAIAMTTLLPLDDGWAGTPSFRPSGTPISWPEPVRMERPAQRPGATVARR